MTTLAYVSVPRLTLGDSFAPTVMENVVALEVEEDIAGMAALEVSLSAQGDADPSGTRDYLDRSVLDFGTKVAVTLGPEDSGTLFQGWISALGADFPGDSSSTVTVKAEDGLQELRRTRRTRTFEGLSTADIAQTIAGDHGLTAQVDVDGPQRRLTSQVNLSDLAFLRTLAQADGAEIWLEDTTLRLQRRPDRDGGSVALVYGEALRSFAVTADLAHQCTDLTVMGWSPADKDVITELADADDLGDELAGDTSGAACLAGAFDERHERIVVAEPLDSADARARARAAYLDRARRFVTGTGTCEGNQEVRVGARVELSGLGTIFTGDYRVVRTCHRWDLVRGYETDFDVERPGLGVAS
jgi:Bacteriophage probable baseplate hub protein